MRESTPILPRALRGRIILLLAAKLVGLVVLYWAFFSPAHQPVADSVATGVRVTGQAPISTTKEE